jgi:hypothetical protein
VPWSVNVILFPQNKTRSVWVQWKDSERNTVFIITSYQVSGHTVNQRVARGTPLNFFTFKRTSSSGLLTVIIMQGFRTLTFRRNSERDVLVRALLRVLSPAGVNDRIKMTRKHDGSVQEEHKCLTALTSQSRVKRYAIRNFSTHTATPACWNVMTQEWSTRCKSWQCQDFQMQRVRHFYGIECSVSSPKSLLDQYT